MPAISVIIPAHNEEKYLPQTLESIRRQSFRNYEVIVVTNGCTDGTEELVKKEASAGIQHLSLSKASVSRARNYGAGKAAGDILLFLDADTQLAPDALEVIQQQFTKGMAVATTRVQPDVSRVKYRWAMQFKNFYNQSGFYEGCSGALICRREDFDKVNGYDPEVMVKEHRKLIIKLRKLGEYGCLPTTVTTSMRRLQQWGLAKATLFWVGQWARNYVGDLKKSEYEKVR